MISRKNISNFLILITVLLTLVFYGHYLNKNKGSIKINDSVSENKDIVSNLEGGMTKFSDVEYKTTSNKGTDFITRGKVAYISKKKPNLIELENVHSFTKLKDKSILNIKSEKATYAKNSKNIRYYQRVIISNKDRTIVAVEAIFYANKNQIKLEEVIYRDGVNLIKSDFAEFDAETNNLQLLMKNKKDRVYGQRKK
ncbi:hypothetical protein [Candidatus Pelagibacter sp. HIMB1517]|uniref:hypothetical protein n=1 Tax=Candidatus Pelagibacter sp. HIMB1517 TaxID=3413341 RepID=UPI003F847126